MQVAGKFVNDKTGNLIGDAGKALNDNTGIGNFVGGGESRAYGFIDLKALTPQFAPLVKAFPPLVERSTWSQVRHFHYRFIPIVPMALKDAYRGSVPDGEAQ
eukprot:6707664-Prymnesium_polylepis.1